jgi:hypothetical protein
MPEAARNTLMPMAMLRVENHPEMAIKSQKEQTTRGT